VGPQSPQRPTGHGVPFAGQPAHTVLDPVYAFKWGFGALKAHLGALVVLFLVMLAGYFVAGGLRFLILAGLGNRSIVLALIIYGLLMCVMVVFGLVLGKGLLTASLQIADGRDPEPGGVFNFTNIGPYVVTALLAMLGQMIGTIACILPGIAFALLAQFWPYAVLDEGKEGVDAIRASIEMSIERFGELVIFFLLAIGINLLGLLACGVGMLVTVPTTFLATAYAWRVLRGRPPTVTYA
jgi:hypothetical protein